ncbi:ABC transporter ATP-binding protein [Anaerotignum sp.]|uniref:ABC transporter ATP-binding protein n=1 Tax=Anaerotignum sp. TaxID=2039241 RepID=UPI0027151D51|nr:ABC transporter ATP-binding protein [Anaerotignum sp.]
MRDKVLLKILNIEKNFEEVRVLHDFSMEANREEIVCIIGPSGCGKSTMLNIISGLTLPSCGEVINNSQNTSYVFQEDRLLPWKDVYENIRIVNDKSSHKTCMELIEKVGLKGFEGFFSCELSGGMRQRCSIARAFNYEADLLLMDEPFKSLDFNLRIGMIHYLLTLWESKKKTIIFVTHEIDEALLLGDRILFLTNRPTKVLTEFRIETPKMKRSLTDPSLVKVRNQILDLLQNENQPVDS